MLKVPRNMRSTPERRIPERPTKLIGINFWTGAGSAEFNRCRPLKIQSQPISMVRNGSTYWYLLDLHGSVLRMVDTTGSSVAAYYYDAFGNILGKNGTLATTNPYRYSGGEGYYTDNDSGLIHAGYRDYNPSVGRWMTEDPIGLAGGENLYGYCGNDPVNAVDPLGLSPDCNDNDDIIASYSGAGGLRKAFNAAFTQSGSDLVNQDYDRLGLTQEYGKVYPAGRDIAINVAVGVATEGLGAAAEAIGAAGETTAITDAAETISDSTASTDDIVYRVWGNGAQEWEEGAHPFGHSWTPVDPSTAADYRDIAGLPNKNSGQFLSIGKIKDPSGITERPACFNIGTLADSLNHALSCLVCL